MRRIYKTTVTGATQVWSQEVRGEKYRTISGKLDGKMVVSEWTTAQRKNPGRANETTPEEQAAAEVEANYTLKLKSGYTTTPHAVSEFFQPMLADHYTARAGLVREALRTGSPAVYGQPKLDGMRCIARSTGLRSRKGNPITAAPHVFAALAPVFAAFPGIVLDGELYSHEHRLDFPQFISMVKKTNLTKKDLDRSAEYVQYWIYDSPGSGVFSERMDRVEQVVGATGSTALRAVDTTPISTEAEIERLFFQLLELEYEGLIIRLDKPYEYKRCTSLLKYKPEDDAEFVVVGIYEGEGNRSGMAGYAIIDLGDGTTCRTNIKGDREYLRGLLADADELVGKEATVLYNGKLPSGALRNPRIKVVHHTPRE